MSIRPAIPADLDTIIELVHGLAEYEREPEAVYSNGTSSSGTSSAPARTPKC